MNIYVSGTQVVFPKGMQAGKGTDYAEGQVSAYLPDGSSRVRIKWKDGHEAPIGMKHILTKEKFDQFTEAGMKLDQIIEYLGMFNGQIYN